MGRCFHLAVILVLAAGANAQDSPNPDHSDIAPGHSYHGEVFNEGARQRAYLMGNTGNVRFPVTTKSREAQAFFEQGVGQLHGFWYFEAERSFRQVILLDPDCAMAYWGMAMANWENEKRAAQFIKNARPLLRNTSRREQLYIESVVELHASTGDKRQRQQTSMDILKKVIADYPDDLEAKAFYVVRQWQFKLGVPTPALDKMLEEIFKVNPLHPAQHYRIHLWDGANASNALSAAALCGASEPVCAHMWHMPGHTYDKLKRYAEAAWQQEASSRADHAYMMHDRILPDQIHNYAHNQEWLVRSLSHIGRVNDAVALAKNMVELPRHPKYNLPTRGGKSASFGRTRLFEVLERYELWGETLKLADTTYLEPTDSPGEQVKRLRLIGLAQAGIGDRAKLAKTIKLLQAQPAKGKGPEPKGKDFKGKGGKGPPLDAAAGRDNAIKELQMLDKLLDEENEEAIKLLGSLKSVSQTRQARYYLQAGDAAKAEQLAKQASDAAKGQVAPLAVYIETLHENGKMKECADAFDRLRKISGAIDSLDSPLFKRLASIAEELKLPADWRVKTKFPVDFGKRPPLDSIGPLVWTPTPGPEWSLNDGAGKTISSAQYSGKPTILFFYLGYGCPHCMEQVTKFTAEYDKFKKAGIEVIAISTDNVESLVKSLQTDKKAPFRVASDPGCAVFKAYRAYDDFEHQPLHGTFLLDARGLVRWHDIGYEPFMDTSFVLAEAKRLLALPVRGER
jgi:peroxiredoxin/tetratricopeptide (TPR) repeat protein